jgi:hypothetical protein
VLSYRTISRESTIVNWRGSRCLEDELLSSKGYI